MARKELKEKAKRERARAQARKRRLRALWWMIPAAVVLVAAVGVLVWYVSRPGERVPSQGRDHIPVGTSPQVDYNTDPPTSGPHYDPSARPGIYDEPMPDGYLVHSLEHGYVIISHNTEGLPDSDAEEMVSQLEEIARSEDLWKLIVIPRPGMESRIALTAWQRIDTMDAVDERRIRRFISAWRDRGPEDTPN